MKKIERPEATVRFTLANGVKLRVDAHARLIRNSDRIDAKIIGIDWNDITTNVCLDSTAYVELLTACLDDEDALSHFEEKAWSVAEAINPTDYSSSVIETIKNAMFQARANVLALKGE